MTQTARTIIILSILLFVSLVVREAYTNVNAELEGDEGEYHELAKQITAGNGFVHYISGEPTAWRTPGLPIVMASIYEISGPHPAVAKHILILFSALTTISIYFLTLFLCKDRLAAVIAG